MRRILERPERLPAKLLLTFLLTLLAFAAMGYHPGLEDDGIYLSGVKASLDPSLFPHDADFFRLQLQASLFDKLIASTVRFTGLSVAWTELLWQFLSFFGTLWAARSILAALFPSRRAQVAGVALLGAMFTLPVAGTALNIADQHLHPRNIATALILFAVSRVLARRGWHAIPLLAAALLIHPIMAAFGASFCTFLYFTWRATPDASNPAPPFLPAGVPLAWIFEPATPDWHRAVATRRYYFLIQWTWYEWLGAIGPLALFWLLWSVSRRRETPLSRFVLAVAAYGTFQQIVALVMNLPPAFIRLNPLQPMRYLQIVYVFLVLIGGALLGEHLLVRNPLRWSVFILCVYFGMFAAQRAQFPASTHLELPGRPPVNPWLQAFDWIRLNTPKGAFFALDPQYLTLPGEDYHCFRPLAERGQLADAVKDAAVVTQVPNLAPIWVTQVDAQADFRQFTTGDFQHLRSHFGADWALVSYPAPTGLDCRWHNSALAVCQIPNRSRPH